MKKLEKNLEIAEAKVTELDEQLADPEIYDAPEEVQRLADQHEHAKALAARLTDEWAAAAEELEGVED